MEEISSLDSFHTDGGDNSAVLQQESEAPKPDNALTQNLNEKEEPSSAAATSKKDKDDIRQNAKSGDKVKCSKPEVLQYEEHESATNEDEFEQISDGTFEVDENSQATSTAATAQDEAASEEKTEVDDSNKNMGSDEDHATAKSDSNDRSAEAVVEDYEANKSSNPNNKSVDEYDESDLLTSTVAEAESDVVDGTSIIEEPSAMDIDSVEQENEEEEESIANVGDVEMKSAPTSPQPTQIDERVHNVSSIEVTDYGRDEVDDIEQDEINQQEMAEKLVDDIIEDGADEEDDANAMDDDAEHEDQPVENVQEPEESDVCLIPDDTETQMTEAEKEQAILARENAEKEEQEEAESAKDDDGVKNIGNLSETSDGHKDQSYGEMNENIEVSAATEEGAEPNESEEQLAEEQEVCGNASGDAGNAAKTIITWIVSLQQTCRQCGEEKSCGFRFKKLDSSDEFDYLCEQSCCDAFVKENTGKFFMRRKKFLVEELLTDDVTTHTTAETEGGTANDTQKDRTPPAGSDQAAVVGKTQICLQCKETKQCKYFLKQDVDTFYICNDDCYNLLNAEEPDKYKLKRHSIRVRNIGATTISSSDLPTRRQRENETSVVARTSVEADAARLARLDSFRRRCSECNVDVSLDDKHLVWETMDFCNEVCLGRYQRTIGSSCQTCDGEVSQTALGKYCVRFGFEVRQFCCAACLNVYKKGLKTCSCCQKDISSGAEGFLAPVGDKEQFKDFCSQACLRRYDSMCNPKKKLRNDICGVCNNEKPVRVEMLLDDKEHCFCSNPCFSAFKFVSNVDADQCGMCCKYFERKGSKDCFTIYKERHAKVFCSRVCINVYIIVNRHIVSCQWCKVKKYNFDMIYKRQEDRDVLTCSLTCLSMYGVSVKAFSRAVAKCDHCNIINTPQYHLTMSDASIRNFCTYQCVMQFQNQFARIPLTLENDLPSSSSKSSEHNTSLSPSKNGVPFPTGLPKRVKLKYSQQAQLKLSTKSVSTSSTSKKSPGPVVPVISNVTSLASGDTEAMIGNVTVRRGRGRGRKMDSPPPLVQVNFRSGRPRKQVDYTTRSPSPVVPTTVATPIGSRRGSVTPGGSQMESSPVQAETKIITLPPYPATVRNVGTSCKPQSVTVGFQSSPVMVDVGIQTDKDYSNKVLIPVPVPIYVPQPMYMYSTPFPVPVPFPLPIPVPVFVPTTRNSAQGILKEIKKIEDRMPTDPLEAELLMMAEMVAEEKHNSDSDSDNEIKPDPVLTPMQYNNNVQQQPDVEVANNASSYNEDVLQMALKMATGDYDQQPNTVDLESAMTANTITNPPPGMVGHDSLGEMNVHHQIDQHQMMDTQRGGRGRKRGAIASAGTPSRNNRSPIKRQRLQDLDSPIQQTSAQHSPQQQQPTEKPDANMCLKYTFGVNAWKQWVMTKNADIEKSSLRRRTFKTELLQMTADELNYSLCLFVKEVRKPNGTEYAPDTIYYLVLGIQQYLYVNGRIDNIFYDPYYERFTECLDEVARKFSVLYNDSQYIVTRVEEEHLWECKQLGAHSPHVLLSTLMFFNTKHFNLTTVEEHMQLSFSHIMKHWKRSASQNAKMPGTRNVLLRFYPPQAGTEANPRKKKVYEQQENEENPLRCPVRLYEFYLSKCPESVKTRNDVFYLQPERSCVPDSPVWYSTQALSQDSLQRMLHRVKMVKEINIALLTS